MNIRNLLNLLLVLVLISCAKPQVDELSKDNILEKVQLVADWQINEFEEGRIITLPLTQWENAALYTGMTAVTEVDDDPRYDQFLYEIGEKTNWNTGPVRLFADDYCIAQMFVHMYMKHDEEKMIAKWKALADTIVARSFDDSLAISKEITHREWAWCDALYMGPPSLAMLSVALDDPAYLQKADSLWWKTSDYLYSVEDSLYFRDNRFFDRKEKNGRKVFWSRGNGWVLGGLAHMMDYMSEDFPSRPKYEQQFREMAQKVANIQQPDGSWHASLYDPVTFPDKESSGTGFFCYALTWGVNNGLLDKEAYMPVIEKAWHALLTSLHPNGKLGYVQNVGDKPVGAAFDNTNVYGVGAFLLAGTELYKMQKD